MDYAVLKQEHGTIQGAAIAASVSAATVSRYLHLLELSEDIQTKVDEGLLPVNQPLRAAKGRTTRKSKLATHEQLLLETVARCVFLTQHQAAGYLGLSYSQARAHLVTLMSIGLIDVNKEFSPYAYILSSKGYAITGQGKPKHFMSASAIHQRLLRNAVELGIREKNGSATFIERTSAWSMGLFPAVGEHLLRYQRDKKTAYALVVIDDYHMAPMRLPHMLNKLHDKNKTKAGGSHILRWRDVVDTVLLYVTDPSHQKAHEKFVQKNKDLLDMRVVIRSIDPIWKVL